MGGAVIDKIQCLVCQKIDKSEQMQGESNLQYTQRMYDNFRAHLQTNGEQNYCGASLLAIRGSCWFFPEWCRQKDKTSTSPVFNYEGTKCEFNNYFNQRIKKGQRDDEEWYGNRKHRFVYDPQVPIGPQNGSVKRIHAQMTNPYLCINCVQ